jgi:hypothetical protein
MKMQNLLKQTEIGFVSIYNFLRLEILGILRSNIVLHESPHRKPCLFFNIRLDVLHLSFNFIFDFQFSFCSKDIFTSMYNMFQMKNNHNHKKKVLKRTERGEKFMIIL